MKVFGTRPGFDGITNGRKGGRRKAAARWGSYHRVQKVDECRSLLLSQPILDLNYRGGMKGE
jgi:hypothetical protein